VNITNSAATTNITNISDLTASIMAKAAKPIGTNPTTTRRSPFFRPPTTTTTKRSPTLTSTKPTTKRIPPIKSTASKPPTKSTKPTPYQTQIYAHLLAIPHGTLTTYASLSNALSSSPRAVGGALRNNPFAPTVPCHRVIASDGFIGGFKGDWDKCPSGINQSEKLRLLKEEGVEFTTEGRLVVREGVWFDGPWDTRETVKVIERMIKGKE
jgi:methylated-DNA-[protein]-cysteine S-methyltransferase